MAHFFQISIKIPIGFAGISLRNYIKYEILIHFTLYYSNKQIKTKKINHTIKALESNFSISFICTKQKPITATNYIMINT
jgi:hypothetical protein